jgi:small subunit ribosomal protein S6
MPTTDTLSYELTFILDEHADQKAGEAKTKELTDVIAKFDGEVTKQELWGRRELAYPIKRNRSGFYVTLWLTLPKNQVKPLEEHMRFDESLIRSLVTKAYTTAQPGSLYPVVEEEVQKEKPGRAKKEETASAEEMLRRTPTKATPKEEEPAEEAIPEEERLKQLDDTLSELLKDEA